MSASRCEGSEARPSPAFSAEAAGASLDEALGAFLTMRVRLPGHRRKRGFPLTIASVLTNPPHSPQVIIAMVRSRPVVDYK
jgi:hypothetical protein